MASPANPLMDQLPLGADPQKLAMLQSLFPQQPPPAPSATPAAPDDIMREMIEASRQGRRMLGAEAGTVGTLGKSVEQLIAEQQSTPVPKMGWLDTQGKPQTGGFLHNLGRALMAIGGATAPGQAIQAAQYGPGIARYEAETGARAKEIEQLRGQQEEHEKLAAAGGGMVSKPITAGAQVERSAALKERADAYTQKVQNDLTVALRSLNLKAISTGARAELDKARAVLDRVAAQQMPLRTQIMQEGVELGAATRTAIANAMQAAGIEKDHPITSLIDSIFGTAITPAAPQTTTGLEGTGAAVPPKKPAAKAAPSRPSTEFHYDKQGNRVAGPARP